MASKEMSREPCPDRILDDMGGAFAMGTLGGSIFYLIKGAMNSPKGERFRGGTQLMRMSAPRTGGGFAVWGGLYSTFDCAMVFARQKEDPWNSIIAGAAAGGLLSLRQGARASAKSAVIGGVLLALCEGIGITANRMLTPVPQVEYDDPNMHGFGFPGRDEEVVMNHGSESSGSSRFGFIRGWFGGGGKKEEGSGSRSGVSGGGGGSEATVLEGFDTPAMPSFDYNEVVV